MDLKVRLEVLVKLLCLTCLLCNDFVELRDEGAEERHRREEQEDAKNLSPKTQNRSAPPIASVC
jgi:hypothetical protein